MSQSPHSTLDNPNSTSQTLDTDWTTIIRPHGKWFDLKLRELWQFKDLIYLFVHRDFVSRYKQTILGPLWYIIQPLFSSGIFTIVFGKFAGLPTDGLPQFLFYLAGNVVWSNFSSGLTSTSRTFTANANLFGKVYFPRLAVPTATLISNLISFGIQFVLFIFFMAFFAAKGATIQPNLWILTFPLLLLMMAGLGLGSGIIISSATTKYRDLQQVVGFGTNLLMYATPIIYPLSAVPGKWKWVVLANPMTPIVETFRYAFLGAGTVNPLHLVYSGVFATVLLLIGILIFNRVERTFMDTV
ncbi:ABC transporter permease [Thermodesulfobacteriota bacterium]